MIVEEVLEKIRIFDGHSDIWCDVAARRMMGETDVLRRRHLGRLRDGGTEGAIFVIWIEPEYADNPMQRTRDIMQCAKSELAECGDARLVLNYDEMQTAISEGKFYVFNGIEGLAAIGGDVDKIDEYYEFGCRQCMLTWNEQNALATGVLGDKDRGLTNEGILAVKRIQDKGMLLDVSHLNEKSFWEVVKVAGAPVIASHSNARALCNAPRNLTDEQLLAIKDADGIVGLNSYAPFISEQSNEQTVESLARHTIHMIDVMGIEHVGCGFDFFEFLETGDSQGLEQSPTKDMEDSSKAQSLFAELKKLGLSDDELMDLGYRNWHRIIKNVIG